MKELSFKMLCDTLRLAILTEINQTNLSLKCFILCYNVLEIIIRLLDSFTNVWILTISVTLRKKNI